MPAEGRRVVSAFVATAFAQEDADSAKAQWRQVADQLRPKVPKLAVLMDEAEHDVLAYMTFPKEHRQKLHSTNPSAQDNSYNPDSRVVAAKEIENATSGESVRKMETIIEDLQEERTGAGGKAYLLETISGGDGETVEKYMMSYTEREPFAVTVLDLTHHTDEEVSSAAKALLDRFDLDSFVGREIASEELIRQVRAGEILTRFSEDSIQELVGKGLIPKGTVLEPQIMLIPTASADGDRYYVKATWEGEGEVFQCLTKLFNEELLAERTLRQEHQVMKQLGGRRYVYWYSKNWALYIAHEIRQCGGNAIFVDGIKFEPCVNC